ncbi:hypothetical protein [Fusobacterium necrophorum]|uniref:hypothetical protein n=1 Tax=Fusobacterium necrophorum TaxID=859 RepID=UPI00370DFB32
MNLKEVIILKINALESLKREWLKIAVEEKESYINKLSKKEKKKTIEKLEEIKAEEELDQKMNELFIEDRKKKGVE